MFRVVAFEEARTGTTALSNIAGLADPHVTVNGDNIMVPGDTPHLMGILAGGSTATSGTINQYRFEAPSLKPYLDIPRFFDGGTTAFEPQSPTQFNNLLQSGIMLVPGENMQMKSLNSQASNAETSVVVVFLGNGNYSNPYLGKHVDTLRFTASISCGAYAWTSGAITFEQALPAGDYAVLGMHVISASGIIARLIFNNQGARPGCIAYDDIDDIDLGLFRHGNLGVWGTFSHTSPPVLDMLCVTTDSSQQGWLDVVKI